MSGFANVDSQFLDVVVWEKSLLAAKSSTPPAGRIYNHITRVIGQFPRQEVKVRTLDIAPLGSESPDQKCSGMARVLKDLTPTRSSVFYLPLPSQL